MEILFPIDDDPQDWNDSKLVVRKHNSQRAKLIRRRLDDLKAARTLEVMRNLPGRCHELKGDRAGQLSIDLDGPYRLLFAPAHNPLPKKPDGGLDWTQVTEVVLVGVVNTHE
ncbi:MAG: killer suppression protein [Bryobacteraceae bacterium]|jgi:proteic killer suppression protein